MVSALSPSLHPFVQAGSDADEQIKVEFLGPTFQFDLTPTFSSLSISDGRLLSTPVSSSLH